MQTFLSYVLFLPDFLFHLPSIIFLQPSNSFGSLHVSPLPFSPPFPSFNLSFFFLPQLHVPVTLSFPPSLSLSFALIAFFTVYHLNPFSFLYIPPSLFSSSSLSIYPLLIYIKAFPSLLFTPSQALFQLHNSSWVDSRV